MNLGRLAGVEDQIPVAKGISGEDSYKRPVPYTLGPQSSRFMMSAATLSRFSI